MHRFVVDLQDVDHPHRARVGGKGAHLGVLSRIEGIRVPRGFCITTDAFARIAADATGLAAYLDRLERARPDDRDAIRTLSAAARAAIEGVVAPDELTAAIDHALTRFGIDASYAVRSSATAEDLPTASFAGQQDTYLNIVGRTAIRAHVQRCWRSLYSERAVTYRRRNGIDERTVAMAVVVQRMVFPQAAGVMFTADPVTGHRKTTAVEAIFGLGEALVSGSTNVDTFKIRDGAIIEKSLATKPFALHAAPTGGVERRALALAQQSQPALTDAQVIRLAELGRRIEAHFGTPQDIEWCLADGQFSFVQSRPITTLFPVPATDGGNRVYLSVGHQQMMTDPMKPLGISMWQLTTPRPMEVAGGRLFVDVTPILAASPGRAGFMKMWNRTDPSIGGALQTVIERGFVQLPAETAPVVAPPVSAPAPIATDPSIVDGLIRECQQSIAVLEREIQTKRGPALFDFILTDLHELKRILYDPRSYQVFMTAMEAIWSLNEKLDEWLGERDAVDTLTRSVPHDVTSEMGLALSDVADVIRPFPDVVAYLEHVEHEQFLEELPAIAGAAETRDAIRGWLVRFGMRGVGEIDITRPRWSERPSTLLPLLLSHIKNVEPGEATRRFERGKQEAWRKEQELLARLRALPGGAEKADAAKQMIDRIRTFVGYREYPKYGKVCRYFVYKQAMLAEAEHLVRAGVLADKEDVFFLTFQEFHDAVRDKRVDHSLLRERKQAFQSYLPLRPPRVLTSEGEAVIASHRHSPVPPGALAGLPASAGVVEGRARVLLEMTRADLERGDILVTAYTDPSWTPLFIAVKGLVTEAGSLMTHGAVIAREYGLPAVVGVEQATRLIRDRQRIRVNGSDGYVEILS